MQRSLERRLAVSRSRNRRRAAIIAFAICLLSLAVGLPRALQPVINAASADQGVKTYLRSAFPKQTKGQMRLSDAGVKFIASFEGFFPELYNDPAGHCTIGYGTLIHLGSCTRDDERRWGRLSRPQALALLRRETAGIDRSLRRLVRVPLNQRQHDMLVSFAYNCGVEALSGSTLLRKLNQGRLSSAADELLRWNRAGGQELPGLTRRRAAERTIFLQRK